MKNCAALALALLLCLLPRLTLAESGPAEPTVYDQIAAQMDSERIIETYAHLKTGAAIVRGDKDPKLRGLQALLNLMGGSLEVDGSIGEKSFDQIEKTVSAYGLQPIAGVSQMEFEDLLAQAYIVRDPDKALALLGPDYEQQARFTQAVLLEQKGESFSAHQLFNALGGFKDSAARAAACAKPWPADGPLIRDSSYGDVDCQLTVKTNREPAQATYFKVFDGDVLVCSLFIAGSGEATVNLPKGAYTCKAGVGTTWFGPKEAFGRDNDAFYQRLTFEGGADKATFRENYKYTLTLGGASENNVNTTYEDADTF